MLCFVAVAAIACRAFFHPSAIWRAVIQSAGISLLFYAVFAAVLYRRRHARAFWIGFAIVGWGLLAADRLATADVSLSKVTSSLTERLHPQRYTTEGGMGHMILVNQPVRDFFSRTAFWLLLIIFEAAGGLLARWMSLREERLARKRDNQAR